MIGLDSITETGSGEAASVLWTGRSGRRYLMEREREAGVAMAPSRLYALENNGVIGWAGTAEDLMGLRWKQHGMVWAGLAGIALLWLAAALTLITGLDYFRKAIPHLKEET